MQERELMSNFDATVFDVQEMQTTLYSNIKNRISRIGRIGRDKNKKFYSSLPESLKKNGVIAWPPYSTKKMCGSGQATTPSFLRTASP